MLKSLKIANKPRIEIANWDEQTDSKKERSSSEQYDKIVENNKR